MRLTALYVPALALCSLSLPVFADSERVKVSEDQIEVLEQIRFASGKAQVLAASNSLLDELAAVVTEHDARISGIRVEGHTDSTGDSVLNAQISDGRAKAVMAALVKRGVVENKLVARGFGATRPIEDNGTPDGRAKNRRVEFVILTSEELAAAKDTSLARIVAASNLVEASSAPGEAFSRVEVGQPLAAGSSVWVGAGSRAELLLRDDTRIVLESNSELSLSDPKDAAKYNAEVALKRGSAWVLLSELALGKMLAFQLPHAYADIDIGWNWFGTDANASRAASYEGRPLWLFRPGRKGPPQQLRAGMTSAATADQGPGKPLQLLPKPRWERFEPVVLPRQGETAGRWERVANASQYRVVLTDAQPIKRRGRAAQPRRQSFEQSELSMRGDGLPPGKWKVRLQALDKDGVPGVVSEERDITVLPTRLERQVTLTGLTATAPAGTRLEAAEGSECATDGGAFAPVVWLLQAGTHEVVCRQGDASFPAITFEVAALEVNAISQSEQSPFLDPKRLDFEVRSSVPLPPGLRVELENVKTDMDGVRWPADDHQRGYPSFIPVGSAAGAVVKIMRGDKEIARTVVAEGA